MLGTQEKKAKKIDDKVKMLREKELKAGNTLTVIIINLNSNLDNKPCKSKNY